MYGTDLAHIHHAGYDELARGAAALVPERLRASGHAAGLVVDLGCGSGAFARAVQSAGYHVLGVDVSPAMVALAEAHAPGARFVVGSLHDVELPACVAITALGEAASYLAEGEDVLDLEPLARRAHAALEAGGSLVFDVIESAGEPMAYDARRAGAGWEVFVEVSEDRERGIVARRIVTVREVDGIRREGVEIHRVKTFARDELASTLTRAGFAVDVVTRYGSAELPPRRVGFIASKPR